MRKYGSPGQAGLRCRISYFTARHKDTAINSSPISHSGFRCGLLRAWGRGSVSMNVTRDAQKKSKQRERGLRTYICRSPQNSPAPGLAVHPGLKPGMPDRWPGLCPALSPYLPPGFPCPHPVSTSMTAEGTASSNGVGSLMATVGTENRMFSEPCPPLRTG